MSHSWMTKPFQTRAGRNFGAVTHLYRQYQNWGLFSWVYL